MKFIKPIITILIIGGLAFWMFGKLQDNKAIIEEKAELKEEVITEIPVKVAAVERAIIDNTLNLTGTFEARKELNIIAEGQGRLTSLTIEEGQTVRKGQTVAKIDDTNIQAQLANANASVDKAQKDVERYERLVKAGAISQQQFEEVKLNAQNLATNVTGIQQQLKYTYVKSPMTGIVKAIKVEEGSFATPGAMIASVIDVSRLKLVVKVPEMDIVKINKGQRVEVQAEVYPDKTFTGKVNLISVQADAGRKYDVEIELPNNKSFPLKAGMYGSVKINPSQGKEKYALFVPRKSIVGSVKDAQVYVVNKENSVSLKSIEVGANTDDKILIQKGLNEGEIVVTTGQINLEEGRKVKVINMEVLQAAQPQAVTLK